MDVIKPVVVVLRLRTADAPPRRAELELPETPAHVSNARVVTDEHAIDPPLERAGGRIEEDLDPVPDAQRQGTRGPHVLVDAARSPPLRHEPCSEGASPRAAHVDVEILVGAAGTDPDEHDFVRAAVALPGIAWLPPKTEIQRRRRRDLVAHGSGRGAGGVPRGIEELPHRGGRG